MVGVLAVVCEGLAIAALIRLAVTLIDLIAHY